jgi:hypothetical protein
VRILAGIQRTPVQIEAILAAKVAIRGRGFDEKRKRFQAGNLPESDFVTLL